MDGHLLAAFSPRTATTWFVMFSCGWFLRSFSTFCTRRPRFRRNPRLARDLARAERQRWELDVRIDDRTGEWRAYRHGVLIARSVSKSEIEDAMDQADHVTTHTGVLE